MLMAIPIVVAKPTTIEIPIYQCQLSCRHWRPPLQWSYWYQDYPTTLTLTFTGKVLHGEISYQPQVTNEHGTSNAYVYSPKEGVWILHEGHIKYTSPYSGLTITEYWRGYLEFDGTPSEDSFVHGVGYQWGYSFLPRNAEDTVTDFYKNAVWDEVRNAWLLGFSIYLWDPADGPQDYIEGWTGQSNSGTPREPFPDPFLQPVPGSNYNPLNL